MEQKRRNERNSRMANATFAEKYGEAMTFDDKARILGQLKESRQVLSGVLLDMKYVNCKSLNWLTAIYFRRKAINGQIVVRLAFNLAS